MSNERIKNVFKYLRRDAMAGTIAGAMAVPLTAGICLMSDYPIMTGLYTVIFATIVGFISYLIRPGNYVGTAGVAAGLAPALALGVNVFGMENMPFVIFLTAAFHALVWKFKWERFILQLVPHYLIEGLLAGVGLKIALKFIPFLYDIEHETGAWLNFEREVVIILSAVSFALFVLLYRFYQKKMPALPYFVIMGTGFGLSFFMPLPMLTIDHVPFQLALPLPHFDPLDTEGTLLLILKMVGYAMMLGTIDVIEQVMSNVAIEKMDPMNRKCDSNNSLLAIWVANMGATFFGGMTNLDGLAKSTTNAVAGAVTKLSNLFTAAVLLLVVLFPIVLSHLPEYALGIIMVYSGWKMIANIAHIRAEGRYALIMAGICGLLVFQLGIFEGLLLVLLGHGCIQYIFIRRLGKPHAEAVSQFRTMLLEPSQQRNIEETDLATEAQLPILRKWVRAFNDRNLDQLTALYAKNAVDTPAFSLQVCEGIDQIRAYYQGLFEYDVHVKLLEAHSQTFVGVKVDSGKIDFYWNNGDQEERHILRYTTVIRKGKIVAHHRSSPIKYNGRELMV